MMGTVNGTIDARINQLPDDLLVFILSRLTLREAAATSVLSQRRRTLWRHFKGSLNFDCPQREEINRQGRNIVWDFRNRVEICAAFLEKERTRFAHWVSQVLGKHEASNIFEFKVQHEVTRSSSCTNLDKWIMIAIEKRVQNLHLDLSAFSLASPGHERYLLPSPNVFNYVRSAPGLAGLQSLVSLYLKSVEVTSEFLEYIVIACPLLEQISLEGTGGKQLVSLNIGHSSYRLKCLSIVACSSFASIRISGPKFSSFSYILGRPIEMEFVDTPLLSNISIIPLQWEQAYYPFGLLSTYFTQLQTLELGITLDQVEGFFGFQHVPELKNLRHLTWTVSGHNERSLLNHVSMIIACPSLQKFTMKVYSWYKGMQSNRKMEKSVNPRTKNHNLSVLELVSFAGCKMEMEVSLFILGIAPDLKKVIIEYDPSCDTEQGNARTLELSNQMPKGAKLLVM